MRGIAAVPPGCGQFLGVEISLLFQLKNVGNQRMLFLSLKQRKRFFQKQLFQAERPQNLVKVISMTKVTKEEKEILDAFESGKMKRVKDAEKLVERHQSHARETVRKDARINIRISSKDLKTLRKQSHMEGIPYQAFIAAILHKYVEGRLRES